MQSGRPDLGKRGLVVSLGRVGAGCTDSIVVIEDVFGGFLSWNLLSSLCIDLCGGHLPSVKKDLLGSPNLTNEKAEAVSW